MSAIFPTYNRFDVHVKHAEGTTIVDQDGKKYLDFISGIGVCNLGHRHPAVKEAIEKQLEEVWHVSNLFHLTIQEEVAMQLVDHCDGDAVFFCNSGAEANEAALKLARKYTQKTKVITFQQSFHGRTFATMAATGQKKIHSDFGPLLQEFKYLPYNDCASLEKEMDENVAAIMVEIIQGEGGVIPINPEFISRIAELCQKYNALLIIDEVQTGMGRTGKPFAYQHFGISPDIITVAKGLGSGLPVGAMIGKNILKEAFGAGVHGTTFGGNPIGLSAAKATLSIVFQEQFLEEVTDKGDYLKLKLTTSLEKNEIINSIRGKGLMVGIDCKSEVTEILKLLRERGLLALNAGPNVIRLLPPLTVTKAEIDLAVDLINDVIKEYSHVTTL
ncbi:acetylornithine transaminase [Cytobacillus sp. S13-E01]|uniref:acetylornithine transaminase n=1 Tax=Cytobacillus sp. S13-E01 TaxID=3031326 RepID=UPI0023D7C097|nr:acetylornithine transaminase [Cytobacillus sp. S13-E01]MDF0728593.1 acetylornithine transaminase [Cytobacillus sp. S13-E01]